MLVLRRGIVACLIAALLPALAARGGSVATDGSLGPAQTITPSANIFTIPQSLGKTAGTNLFQSLSTLNLSSGQTASFTGASSIRNVFTRVTGGPASIDGTLQCTISGANFFLVDSAGVLFGPGATLDISGSFAVSTADYLQLADGTKFMAVPSASDALLSTAAPAAFGFLAASPAPLSVNGALTTKPGQALTLAGGGVTLSSAQLIASGGAVSIVSVASPGVVNLPTSTTPPTLSGVAAQGPVQLTSSTIMTDGPGGGAIFINGSSLSLTNSSISAQNTGATNGTGINAALTGNLLSTDSSFLTDTSSSGNAGPIFIAGQDISISGVDTNGNTIRSSTISTSAGAGAAGNVTIDANSLSLLDGATIKAGTDGPGGGATINLNISGDLHLDGNGSAITVSSSSTTGGAAGAIDITAQTMEITNGAALVAQTDGTGAGGSITIGVSGALTLDAQNSGLLTGLATTSISSNAGSGNAGAVTISAGSLAILNGASIDASTDGPGNAGTITINVAGDADIDGGSGLATSGIIAESESTSGAAGNGGTITLTAGSLEVQNGSEIDVSTFGNGAAGAENFILGSFSVLNYSDVFANTYAGGNAGNMNISVSGAATLNGAANNYATLSTESEETSGGGTAGNITLAAGSLSLTNSGTITAATLGNGNAGSVNISVSGAAVMDNALISTVTEQTTGGGNAGNITLSAGSLSVTDGALITAVTLGNGNAANIAISVSGAAVVDASLISTESEQTTGGGNAGNVTVAAGSLSFTNGGAVFTSTLGNGNAGNVNVSVSGAAVLDAGTSGLTTGISAISSSNSPGGGNAGNISLSAGALSILNGASIRASTESTGVGGSIIVNAGSLLMSNGGFIDSNTLGTGNGGNLDVTVSGSAVLQASSAMDATTISAATDAAGAGGNVTLSAGSLQMLGYTELIASAFASGNGGNVTVNVGGTAIVNGMGSEEAAEIASKTAQTAAGGGKGGDVTVAAGDLQVLNGGDIGSDTLGSGACGNVTITANSLEMNNDAIISADTFATGAGGNVLVNVAGPITMSGVETIIGAQTGQNSAGAGNGGSITVNANSIQISNEAEIDTSSIGLGNAGALDVNAGQITLNGLGITPDTTGLFAEAAAQTPASTGNGGSITVNAAQMSILNAGDVSTRSSDAGQSGNILITAGSLDINGGFIESAANDAGNAGSIGLNVAAALTMENSGLILATSLQSLGGHIAANVGSLIINFAAIASQTLGLEPGGDISVNAAGNIQLSNGAVISTIGFHSDAGSINLQAGSTVELSHSDLLTEAEGAGGNITIDPTYVILNDSAVIASAVNRNGGNILITPDVLLVSTDSVINASSARGVSGQVEVTAPDQDLAGQLVTLPSSLYSVEETLQDICAVRLGGDFSSFITAPNGGLPLEPGGWMPSSTGGSNALPQTQPSGNQ